MEQVLCELIDVNKRFSGRMVVSGINLTVRKGDMIAIMGRSGSGKTTLLNMMGLLDRSDGGDIRLFGRHSPSPGSPAATLLRRTRIAYLFQNAALLENETIDHNLDVALLYVRGSRSEKRRLKESALTRVGLHMPLTRRIYELSGGEQQRVAVARILLKPCDFILADEPTGSLDEESRDGIIALLRQLNQDGKTIVIVTHDPSVAQACDSTVHLTSPQDGTPETNHLGT
ncbi:MAG: ABC transporter ATP-binding protein [Bacilli bacterium]